LSGTSVARLDPKRNHVPVKTIPGITKLFYFEWPIEGPFAGYIQAQVLPHVGTWSRYSPADVSKLVEEPLHKPTPDISTHTKPNSAWNFHIVQSKGTVLLQLTNILYSKKKNNNNNFVSTL
jgi:hypothetical protein